MDFAINNIDKHQQDKMVKTGVWSEDAPVSFSRLKQLTITHYNFTGGLSVGKLVVLDSVSKATLDIFRRLLEMNFPINRLVPMEYYQGNDFASMNANNSSGFNFRKIADSPKLSMHSYGLAIDINPLQNPYILTESNKCEIFPVEGAGYLDRSDKRAGMVEPVVELFAEYGFSRWGGIWKSPVDYHHFQVPRDKVSQYL